jgi:hypothetical protein
VPQSQAARFDLIQIQIQTNSNLIQIVTKFDRFKKDLPEIKKFGIKYVYEGLEERNNFIHRNFSRLGMEMELKFWEVKV